MNIKNIIVGTAVALSLNVASYSVAEEGAYIGAQYAQVEYDQSNGVNATPTGLIAIGGYNFSDHVALEGRFGFGLSDDGLSGATVSTDLELDSIVSLLGKFSLGGSISPYLLAGYSDLQFDASNGSSAEGDSFSFGVGVDFSVTEHSAISVEYIQYADTDGVDNVSVDVTALSVGYNYSF